MLPNIMPLATLLRSGQTLLWLFVTGWCMILMYSYIESNLTKQQSRRANDDVRRKFNADGRRPLHVLIVTQMRSGSTFVGELLNKNHHFSYFFEPLYEFRNQIYGGKSDDGMVVQLPLKNMFQCHFQDMPEDWRLNNSRRSKWNCLHSQVVQNSSMCTFHQGMSQYVPNKHMHDGKSVLEAACKIRQHVAIKTIRVTDIGDLKLLAMHPDLNIKIVHLVRDPRAVYLSRRKVSGVGGNTPYACKRLEYNLRYWTLSDSKTPSWLRKRYILLRYEDLAEKPFQIAKQLYKFLDIPIPGSVEEWLRLNTAHDQGNEWSTTRNSRRTASTWRNDIGIKDVIKVQSHCYKPMIKLGYRLVFSQNELLNLSLNLVDTLPLNSFDTKYDRKSAMTNVMQSFS